MTQPPERVEGRGPAGLVLGAALFSIFAPAPLFALPLVGMLVVSRARSFREIAVILLGGGVSVWWLLQSGELPDQVVRAGAVVATVTFVVASARTGASFTHRALGAIAVATVAILIWCVVFGRPWDELHWWVQYRTGTAGRMVAARMRQVAAAQGAGPALGDEMDSWFEGSTRFVANGYPAIASLEILMGLALATAIFQRIARNPIGAPLGRLRDFRFSEHLGWAAAVPLIILLIPKLAAGKLVATNLLVVAGVLYALRGVAVAAFGLWLMGAGGVFTSAVVAIAMVFMLPVMAGVILIGVVDSGMDLRRRLLSPPARG